MAGAKTWHRNLNAIKRLQAKAPAEGEGVQWAQPVGAGAFSAGALRTGAGSNWVPSPFIGRL